MLKIINSIIEIIFPAKCYICKKIQGTAGICSLCWNEISFHNEYSCVVCSYPFEAYVENADLCGNCIMNSPSFDRLVYMFSYDNKAKELISQFKFSDNLTSLNLMVNFLHNISKDFIEDVDLIIPVPIHKFKLIKRKYNQSALLANGLAKLTKIKCLANLLQKKRNNLTQSGLTKAQRQENVKNVFSVNKKFKDFILGKNILLIDDVYTTGATINEICKLFKKHKVNKIYVATIARTLNK